jgi:hypothetical protein
VADSKGEARRSLSSSLFNNTYFADVVLQIAALAPTPGEFVTTRKIASACGLGDSVVRTVVVRLEAAEMLHRLPRMSGPRSEQNFSRSTSNGWNGLVDLCRSLASSDADARAGR